MSRNFDTIRVVTSVSEIKNAKKIAIYGTGGLGEVVFNRFKDSMLSVEVVCFFCSYRGAAEFLGLPVFMPGDISSNRESFDAILIASTYYAEIVEELVAVGYHDFIVYDPRGSISKNSFLKIYDDMYPSHDCLALDHVSFDAVGKVLKFRLSLDDGFSSGLQCEFMNKRHSVGKDRFVSLDLGDLPGGGGFFPMKLRPPDGVKGSHCEGNALVRYCPSRNLDAFVERIPTIVSLLSDDIHIFPNTRVDDWNSFSPSDDDVDFAYREWGQFAELDDFMKAQNITRSICSSLAHSRGMPSCEVRALNPFEQYQLAVDGKTKLWCENYASILCLALRCFDIPARRVYMVNTVPGGGDTVLAFGSGHQCVEFYAIDMGGWIWSDPYFNILSSKLCAGVYLNVMEFSWNLRRRRPLLEVSVCDCTRNEYVAMPFADHVDSKMIAMYYSMNQIFRFRDYLE